MPATWSPEPARTEDAAEMAELIRDEEFRMFGLSETDVRSFVTDVQKAGQPPDAAVIRSGGAIIAHARVQERRTALTCADGVPDPAREALLRWAEARQSELGRIQRMQTVGPDTAQAEVLRRAGYGLERSYLRMRRTYAETGPPEPVAVADGYRLRGVDLASDPRVLWQVSEAGFADRPDSRAMTFEVYAAEHRQFQLLTADWSFIAETSAGEPVGAVVAWARAGEGFIAELSVTPAHRRHGLARALLLASMVASHAAGRESAALLVASDNPQAMALYESAGMRAAQRWDDYVRPSDPDRARAPESASAAPISDNSAVPLSDLEISKDTIQTAVESGFDHVGKIASIITSAGRDITRELGDWATDMFEMRDAGQRAKADRERQGTGG